MPGDRELLISPIIPIILLSLALLSPLPAVSSDTRPLSFPIEPQQEKVEHPWVPWEPRPVLGPQKTLVLMVEFTDVRFLSSLGQIASMVETVNEWFKRSSYGKMSIDYYIYPRVITLPNPMSYYGAPESGAQRGDNPRRIIEYYRAIFRIVQEKTEIDLGEYTHVITIHAGGDEAVTGNPYEIWSHCLCLGPAVKRLPKEVLEEEFKGILYHRSRKGGWVALYGVETVSEEEDMHVMIHEFAHSNGIPDLYVYAADGYSKGSEAGMWSNMDIGAIIGADIDGWGKYILGWIEPKTYTIPVDDEVELYTLDNWEGLRAILVEIPGKPHLYYFIHARRRAGLDENLPGEGVLVFKVNKLLPRSVENNRMVRVYDADPETPEKCERYKGDFGTWSVCAKLDAAYNSGGRYIWQSFILNFDNPTFWDSETGFGLRVLSYDKEKGLFKIRLAGSAEEVGAEEEAETTETTTITTTTQTPTKTITVEVKTYPTGDIWTLVIILIGVVAAASILAMSRGRRPHPPPPPPSQYIFCPSCGARAYSEARYCWRCGARLRE